MIIMHDENTNRNKKRKKYCKQTRKIANEKKRSEMMNKIIKIDFKQVTNSGTLVSTCM